MKVQEITIKDLAIMFLTSVLMDDEINFYEGIDDETKEYTGYWGAKAMQIFDGWCIIYGYYGEETYKNIHTNLNEKDKYNVEELVENLVYALGKESENDVVYLIVQD